MASITKRGDTFRIMVSLGYGMDGRQIRKITTFLPPDNVTEGKARKLAEAYAHEFEKHCRGLTNLGENMKFHELATWYYTEIAPNTLKGTTIYCQRQLLEDYILPELGHLKLKDISTGRLDELLNRLVKNGGIMKHYALIDKDIIPLGQRAPFARKAGIGQALLTNLTQGKNVWETTVRKIADTLEKPLKEVFVVTSENKPLSPSTIENILGVISAIFCVAVKKGIVEKNPALNTTPPKRVKYQEKPYMDDNMCRRLLSILEQHPDRQFALMVKTFIFTGLRAGELCGLHWSDIDLDNAVITVRHTLIRLDGEYFLSTPKTKTSERVVNIPAELAEELRTHKIAREEFGVKFGADWNNHGNVFTS
jgi:integrase